MSAHVLRSSFNAGEISPLMDARVDAEKYGFSCRTLENFIPKIYGGAFRRPGLVHLGETKDETKQGLLIPFNVSASTRYMLEFGDTSLRIWESDGSYILDAANGTLALQSEILELTTPYADEDLSGVKHVQLNNVAYFVHPDYTPQKLTRSIVNNGSADVVTFTWEAVSWAWSPFQDTNTSDTTVYYDPDSGSGYAVGDTGFLKFPDSTTAFAQGIGRAGVTGLQFLIGNRRDASSVELSLNAASSSNSSEIDVLGDFTVSTYGTWDGVLKLQKKDDAANWLTLKSWDDANGRNIVYDSTELDNATLRLRWEGAGTGTNASAVLDVAESTKYGIVEITTDTLSAGAGWAGAACVVRSALDATNGGDETTDWAAGAFSDVTGYPRAVTFHEQRLWFGGTDTQPNTFWGSITNDFENFRRGAFDTDSVAFTLAAQEGSAIESMLSHEALLLFTQTEEWTVTTSEQTVITPSNIFVRRQSRFGSAARQSILALNNILFVQRGARKLREFVYSATEAGGQSQDLTLLAEHITRSGIKQMAYQQQPDPIIWCVTNDGELLSLTYEATQSVIAWARHPTSGTIESVAVIYGDSDSADEVWVIAVRTINGTSRRFVERLDPEAFSKLEEDTQTELIYVDSAVYTDYGTPTTKVTGLHHLTGETVSILADGYSVPDQTVTDGMVTLPQAATKVVVGLPYTSTLQASKTEFQLEDGSSMGRTFTTKRMTFNLWQTLGLEYADSSGSTKWFDVPGRDITTPLDAAEPLFTGLRDVTNLGSHKENIDVTVRQTNPLPANILAIVFKSDVTGN